MNNETLIKDIPSSIYNNPHMRQYVKYDTKGYITAMYSRAMHPDDHKETSVSPSGEKITMPLYYGEWVPASKEHIDAINEEAKANNRIAAIPEESKSHRERELDEAMTLLQKLKALRGLD